METWRWVTDVRLELAAAGHERLAELLGLLPELLEIHDPRVDELLLELTPLALAADNPWLELLVRRWDLQHRRARPGTGSECLELALELHQLASVEGTQGCPQSVCAARDLAACLGTRGDPKDVDRRLRLAQEALDRAEPSWPCRSCLAGEVASALGDGGRHAQVIDFVGQFRRQPRPSGSQLGRQDPALIPQRARALLAVDRPSDAIRDLEQHDDSAGSESEVLAVRLLLVRALVALEQFEDALELMLPAASIIDHPELHEEWLLAVDGLLAAEQMVADVELGVVQQEMFRLKLADGALHGAIAVGLRAAEQAIERQARGVARLTLERVRGALSGVEAPRYVLRLEQLEARMNEQLVEECTAATDQELLVRLATDPEICLEQLEAGLDALGPSQALARLRARTLQDLGFSDLAEEQLRAAAEGGDVEALGELGDLLLEHRRYEEIERVLPKLDPKSPSVALWIRARLEMQRGNTDAARAALSMLLDRESERASALGLLAQLERQVGRLDDAMVLLDELTARAGAEPGDWDWERLIVATLQEDWAKVRESAERLGLEVPGTEGPIDESWGLLLLEFDNGPGVPGSSHHAIRTGPVTARVVELSGPDVPEHLGDRVVFDPTPVSEVEDDAMPCFRVLNIVRAGGLKSYAIDGVYPGVRGEALLRGLFDHLGGGLEIHGGERYRVEVGGEPLEGMLALCGVPEEVDPQELHRWLAKITADFEHPLVWPGVVRQFDDQLELQRQLALAEQYGL